MNAKERFIEYLKTKGIGQTSFEQSSGLSRGSISQKSGFSANSIEKIAIACPDLNLEWLILGNEPMLKSESSIHEPKPSDNNLVVIEELKSEIIALKAENKVLRELAGLGERKDNKSA